MENVKSSEKYDEEAKGFWARLFCSMKNDPVKKCDVYRNEGCAHVDGIACDFPECSMLKEYREAAVARALGDE